MTEKYFQIKMKLKLWISCNDWWFILEEKWIEYSIYRQSIDWVDGEFIS